MASHSNPALPDPTLSALAREVMGIEMTLKAHASRLERMDANLARAVALLEKIAQSIEQKKS